MITSHPTQPTAQSSPPLRYFAFMEHFFLEKKCHTRSLKAAAFMGRCPIPRSYYRHRIPYRTELAANALFCFYGAFFLEKKCHTHSLSAVALMGRCPIP